MAEHRFAVATAAATFALLAIGGMVHATGSSLACPDWPLCYGQFFPAMEGGVLFEHGHRLVALLVALLTVALAVLVWRRRRGAAPRAMAALAVLLVLAQASLGAVTVIYKLPLLVSAGHLATSMAFFSLVVALAVRLGPASGAAALGSAAPPLAALAAAAVYLQIVLGAFVRHAAAGLACGQDLLLCQGALWPADGPARLHMAHRLGGVLVAALVLAAAIPAWRAARAAERPRLAALAAAGPVLVAAQLAAGLWTVATLIAVPVVTLHLALGALLLAVELSLFLLSRPRGAALPAPGARAAGLQPAAG
jgi:heme A synthase